MRFAGYALGFDLGIATDLLLVAFGVGMAPALGIAFVVGLGVAIGTNYICVP